MSEKMSVIVVQLDSLNRHFLSCYGNDWVQAPNLSAFAERAAVFEQHYTGSLPCMPARREIWAGVEEFWWRPWGPLEPWDRPLAHLIGRRDVPTQLVTDHYHFFEWGAHGYAQDFRGYDFIRGHEYDNWRTEPIREVPDWAEVMLRRHPGSMIYLRNVQHFEGERDFFGPKVMSAAAKWLQDNAQQPQFYLHVDSFDVHEPFHVPEPYRSLYTDDDYRRYSPWPPYGRADDAAQPLAEAELVWARAQFAGKLTMVDEWLGRLFDKLDEHKLWERTCVIVTTDHGHFLGEHGWIGKPNAPLYHTLCHIPLLIWHPDGAHGGGRVRAITQTVDLYATVLELMGLAPPEGKHVHSRSLVPLLLGQTDQHRHYAVYGYNGERVGISDPQWTLLRDHDPLLAEVYWYSHHSDQLASRSFPMRHQRPKLEGPISAGTFIPGVAQPVWRLKGQTDTLKQQQLPQEDLLFHNPSDPAQERNLAREHPEAVRALEAKLREHLQRLKAPEEQGVRLRLT